MDNLLSHATPPDREAKGKRRRLRERCDVPSLAAALRPTCASFDYFRILACAGRGVTSNLQNRFELRAIVAYNRDDPSRRECARRMNVFRSAEFGCGERV
jgi:hypothetical protein